MSGIAEVLAAYIAKVDALDDAVYAAIQTGALKIERTAKELFRSRDEESIPNEPPRVQTGRARASITHEIERSERRAEATIGTNIDYGPDLEFGTSETFPHPFMAPAYIENEEEIMRDVENAARSTL